VVALGLLLAGCEEGPTLPDTSFGTESAIEAQAAAALDQSALTAEALVQESLAQIPEGDLPETRTELRRAGDSGDVRRRDDKRPHRDVRAELAVSMAGESVAMAKRLLEGSDPSPEQLRHLDHAHELLRRAEAVLDEGREAAAIELARAAQVAALKAVVLPRGVSEEEARKIHALAAELLEQARSTVSSDPSDVRAHLLRLAERLFERGERKLANGVVRGVVDLWTSASLSSLLIG